MMKMLLKKLFSRKNSAEVSQSADDCAEPTISNEKMPRHALGNGFYWEFEEISNGYGGYKTVNAYLLKIDDPTFRRCIVSQDGLIQNFPGYRDELWQKSLEIPMRRGEVNFAFWISPYKNGKAAVRWLLQPDGRYFADDDGFGAEKCVEIEMYSSLDENGDFVEPFFKK